MSDFNVAIDYLLAHEGGYVDHPHDPGGATNYGISLRFLKQQGVDVGDFDGDGDVDVEDIRQMDKEDAIHIYKVTWWDKYNYSGFHDQRIATKVFDLSVNMGARQAHILLQRACKACGHPLIEDGILGKKTFLAANSIDGKRLLPAIRSEAAGYYRALVAQKDIFKDFINGWLNRAYA